jgi:hypothetical protein
MDVFVYLKRRGKGVRNLIIKKSFYKTQQRRCLKRLRRAMGGAGGWVESPNNGKLERCIATKGRQVVVFWCVFVAMASTTALVRHVLSANDPSLRTGIDSGLCLS